MEKRKILSEEFGMELSGDLESEVRDMCNLSQGILERGLQQGERNAKRKTARNLAGMGMPAEKIAQAVQEPVELVEEWLKESRGQIIE